MSSLALWSRPAWDTDRWLRDFFGPAAATDWFKPATSGYNRPRKSSRTATTRWYASNSPASTSRRTSPWRSSAVAW